MSIVNVNSSNLPQISGTVAGVGGGALLLPHTGSTLVGFIIMTTVAVAGAMLVSLAVSKYARRAH